MNSVNGFVANQRGVGGAFNRRRSCWSFALSKKFDVEKADT
jgi:hypothetical protein